MQLDSCQLLLALPAPLCLGQQSTSQGCLLVVLKHPSLLEQMSTGIFCMLSPQGILEKGGFGGNGDARLELAWKAEGISPNQAGVKCLLCVWQPCVDTNPEGDLRSH